MPSRDRNFAISVSDIEDVALPLYQGVMIRHFDPNTARYISGAGNRAKWEQQTLTNRYFRPQFLLGRDVFYDANLSTHSKLLFRDLSNPTNSRTLIAAFCPGFPAGNKAPTLQPKGGLIETLALTGILGSFAADYALRIRFATSAGASSINPFILYELPLVKPEWARWLAKIVAQLSACSEIFAPDWLELRAKFGLNGGWRQHFALTQHERLRCTAMLNAVVSHLFGLTSRQLAFILTDCDLPVEQSRDRKITRLLNPKGFWRIDKELNPELRQTVLSVVALQQLEEVGLQSFLTQNEGMGWMIPDALRLSDYGLGRSESARTPQPVAMVLGPRLLEWQRQEDAKMSWEECSVHANLIRQIVPVRYSTENYSDTVVGADEAKLVFEQGGLF